MFKHSLVRRRFAVAIASGANFRAEASPPTALHAYLGLAQSLVSPCRNLQLLTCPCHAVHVRPRTRWWGALYATHIQSVVFLNIIAHVLLVLRPRPGLGCSGYRATVMESTRPFATSCTILAGKLCKPISRDPRKSWFLSRSLCC